jgi:putative selenium metabolism hydrolase
MAAAHPYLARAKKYENRMVRLLRELVAIPSRTGHESEVIDRIRQEMKSVGVFDRIWTDKMGNLLARVGKPGKGKKLIAIDAHVDTVGVGDPKEWKHDPYKGKVAGGRVWGRGAGDQSGAIPAMIYACKMLDELEADTAEFCLLLTCTVMEEDCEGLCWRYLIDEEQIRPDVVVVTDSTDCDIFRGQRGRIEIGVTTHGRSCHASMPQKGDNAIYKVARIIREIESLHARLRSDPFLGPGTITVTHVECKSPSRCAVPGQAYIHLDRRLTTGDTKRSAVAEVKDAIRRAGVKADVEVLTYAVPSYTGLVYPAEQYFPTWCEAEDALQVRAAVKAHRDVLGKAPTVHRWTFSTNGVAIAGLHGIPSVGFGPAPESVAHTVNDSVPIEHLVKSAAFYAGFPQAYCDLAAGRANRTNMAVKRK